MTVNDVVLVSFGIVVNALTFGLGIMVGVSMRRKEVTHDGNENYPTAWHDAGIERRRANGCSARCEKGCANVNAEPGANERASRRGEGGRQ